MNAFAYLDTYKQYKAGTKQIIQWLVETTNYAVPKHQASRNAAQGSAKLPCHDLPRLAKQAISSLPPSGIPQSLRTTLNQVINARKECAAHHKLKSCPLGGTSKLSTEGHDHFIRTLEEVREILGAPPADDNHRASVETFDRPVAKDLSLRTLPNRFDLLELQDPTQEFPQNVNSPGPTPGKATGPKAFVSTVEIEEADIDEVEESLFASFCFLLDCHRVRSFVRSIWVDYRQRRVSLTAAALTTNMAFDVINRLSANLAVAFPEYSTYEALDHMILDEPVPPSLAGQHGEGSIPPVTRAVDSYSTETLSPNRGAFCVLQHLRKGYEKRAFRDFDIDNNQFDWSDRCTESHPLPTPVTIWNILIRMIPDIICFVLGTGGTNSFVDEFSCGILDFYESHNITVPLVISCELFADIYFVLFENIQRPFQELNLSAAHATSAMKKSELYTKILGTDRSFPQTRETFGSLGKMMDLAVSNDAVSNFRQAHIVPTRDNLTSFCMLRHHPTLCGILRFHIDRTMCYGGLRMSNEWQGLIGVVHLYNAVRQSGQLQMEWPDMEAVIEFYGSAYLFVGEPPVSSKEYAKRHMLAAGLPPSAFARDSRVRQTRSHEDSVLTAIRTPKRSGRLFEVKQPLLTIMRERYSVRKGKKEPGMMIRDVEIALKALESGVTESNDKKRILKQWRETRTLTPVDTLKAIFQGIQAEEVHMQFDFLTFNRGCLELLRRLRDRLIRDFPSIPWGTVALENQNLYTVATIVFGVTARDDDMGSDYLRVVCLAMEDLIRREGAKGIERARQRCHQA